MDNFISNMITENMNLIHSFINNELKPNGFLNHMFTYDDAFQTCIETIIKYGDNYDPEKGALSTYLYRCFRCQCLKEWKQMTPSVSGTDKLLVSEINQIQIDSFEELEEKGKIEGSYNDKYFTKDVANIISKLLETLTIKEKQVLLKGFGLIDNRELSCSLVGKEMQLTKEMVRRIEQKGLRKLRHPIRSRFIRDFVEDLDNVPLANISTEERRRIYR